MSQNRKFLTKIEAFTIVMAAQALLGYLNPNSIEQGPQLVRIIDVECPKCLRKFRTVPAVVEHAGSVYCSVCGTSMKISEPKPITVLSDEESSEAAQRLPRSSRRSC